MKSRAADFPLPGFCLIWTSPFFVFFFLHSTTPEVFFSVDECCPSFQLMLLVPLGLHSFVYASSPSVHKHLHCDLDYDNSYSYCYSMAECDHNDLCS